jgi:hypothetical protein
MSLGKQQWRLKDDSVQPNVIQIYNTASKAKDDSVLSIESKTSLSQQLQPSKPSSMLPNSCHGMFADYNKRGHFKDNLAAYMMYAKLKDRSNYVCDYVDRDDF